MDCKCTTEWSRWIRTGSGGWAIVKVTSTCAPVPIANQTSPDGSVSGPCPEEPRRDAGAAPHPGGCRVTYTINVASASPVGLSSFSTGADTFSFTPPVGPNVVETIEVNSSLPDREHCLEEHSGVVEVAHVATGAKVATLTGVKICRLRGTT